MSATPHKLSHKLAAEWQEHSFPALYQRQVNSSGQERLIFGVPAGDVEVIGRLLPCMEQPLFLCMSCTHLVEKGLRGVTEAPSYRTSQ